MLNSVDPSNQPMQAPAFVPTTFKTSLRLTQDQERKLVQRALDRIEEVKGEMGLGTAGMLDGWQAARRLYQMQYDNDWSWRPATGGIFQHSNFSLNIVKRFARLAAAKSVDELVGTEPFFGCMPRQPRNALLAKQSEKYVQDELSLSNVRAAIVTGLLQATIIGEAVCKLSYVTDSTHYRGPAIVMVDAQTGQPIQTSRGEYIYRKDNFLYSTIIEGQLVLEKDPSIVAFPTANPQVMQMNRFPQMDRPQFGVFKLMPDLDQVLITKEAVDANILDPRDFICPLTAETVKTADICGNFYDVEAELLSELYRGAEMQNDWLSETGENKSLGAGAPREIHGERNDTGSRVLRKVNIGEVYLRCDADEDGQTEEIMMVLDMKRKRPIFYDYMANHMDERPFFVIPGVEPVPKRWYGVGMFEMFQHRQEFVDLQYNRANFRSSNAGGVTFWNPQATREGRAGLPLLIGHDVPYTLQDGYQGTDAVSRVRLSEEDEEGMNLMNLTIQSLQSESGSISAADGNMSGLPTTETATGIRQIEETGDVQQKFTITPQANALNELLRAAQALTLENMSEREMFFFQQGETSELVELNRDEVRRLGLQIKLVLTRTRGSKLLDTSKLAKEIAVEYYTLPPIVASKVRPLYVSMLKALEISDADALLADPTQDPILLAQAQQSEAPQAPTGDGTTQPALTQQPAIPNGTVNNNPALMGATAPLRKTSDGSTNPAQSQLHNTPATTSTSGRS